MYSNSTSHTVERTSGTAMKIIRAPQQQTNYANNGLPTLNQEINQSPYFTNYSTDTAYLQDYNNRLAQESSSNVESVNMKSISNAHTDLQQRALQQVQSMMNQNDFQLRQGNSTQMCYCPCHIYGDKASCKCSCN